MQSLWMWIGEDEQGGGQAENSPQNQGQSQEEVTPPPVQMISRAETRGRRERMPSTPSGIRSLLPVSRRFCARGLGLLGVRPVPKTRRGESCSPLRPARWPRREEDRRRLRGQPFGIPRLEGPPNHRVHQDDVGGIGGPANLRPTAKRQGGPALGPDRRLGQAGLRIWARPLRDQGQSDRLPTR